MNRCPKCNCQVLPEEPFCVTCEYVAQRNRATSPFADDARLSMTPVILACAAVIVSMGIVLAVLHSDPCGVTQSYDFAAGGGVLLQPAPLNSTPAGDSFRAPSAASLNRKEQ